jgi:hypothetical protein
MAATLKEIILMSSLRREPRTTKERNPEGIEIALVIHRHFRFPGGDTLEDSPARPRPLKEIFARPGTG